MKLSELQRRELTNAGVLQQVAYAAFLDPDVRIIQRSGGNTDIDTSTFPEDCWGGSGLYQGFPLTAETVSVASSSVNDTAAGTGARTIRISGLDATGNFQTEIVTLNGTTPVVTTTQWLRINRAFILTSGNNNRNFNAGNITINQSVTTTNVFGIIDIGLGALKAAVYTIPKGTAGVLRNVQISGLRSTSSFSGVAGLYVRENNAAPRIELPAGFSNSQVYNLVEEGGIYLPELTDITIRIMEVSVNNVAADASFELYLLRA